MVKLVPRAIELAQAEKPDVRLLRLICRYSSTPARKLDTHHPMFLAKPKHGKDSR